MRSLRLRQLLNWSVTVGSALLCLLLLPTRLPGMELLGVTPNWLVIWVVSWSVKRSIFQGAIAGGALGLIHDGMTPAHYPADTLSLVLVGILTARLQKQRFIQEDLISVALIVFMMAAIAQTVAAVERILLALDNLAAVWTDYQRITLASAIISSLWTPIIYYPLSLWWNFRGRGDQETGRRGDKGTGRRF